MAGYIVLASIGHVASRPQCHGVFVFAHVFCAFNSAFSASIFWTRCGALCNWNRYIIIPLGIYGTAISAFALVSSADDFAFKPDNISSSVCIVSMKSTSQSVSRFLFASFDLMVAAVTFYALWYKSTAESWISRILLKDQLVYITVTMTAYLGLASSFLLVSPTAAGFGLLCPSVISVVSCRLFLRLKRKGKNNCRNRAFHQLAALDKPGINGVFQSRGQSPSSSDPSSSRSLNKDSSIPIEKELIYFHNSPIIVEQRNPTIQFIKKREEDEERGRSASLSDSNLSQCGTRRTESVPAKKRGSNGYSSRRNFHSVPPTSSQGDIEMCHEVLQGDQEGFPRRVSPRMSPSI